MVASRELRRGLVLAVALVGAWAWPAPASAGFTLNARYAGVVTDT